MPTNPYADSEQLPKLLWEAEALADKYSFGDMIFIRTRKGWRAFLGGWFPQELKRIEKTLDKNVPSMEQVFEVERHPDLIQELQRLIANCMYFEGYIPMSLTEPLEDDE
jgi:hypothetical protein